MKRIFLSLLAVVSAVAWPGTCFADEKPIKAGFVYVSPANEAGWSYAHDQGRKAVAAIPGVTTMMAESVPEGRESERVIEVMAQQGCDIIFTTSFGYMEPTAAVAKRYPDKTFLHCSGYKTAANLSSYFGRMYQARYLTGLVAGAMTRSGVIGYAAAFPIPEVLRGINAFALGARSVNPTAEIRIFWTRTWWDMVKEKEAVRKLVASGADVIAQHQDSPAPQQAAEELGVYSVGYNTDMSTFAPKAHLVAAIWDWAPFYADVLTKVRNGQWASGSFWPGLESGIVGISSFGPMVPPEMQNRVRQDREAIIKGELAIFTGPLRDHNGRLRFGEGESLSDKEMLNMDWFVEGVTELADDAAGGTIRPPL